MKYAIARYYFDSLFHEEANSNFIQDLRSTRPYEEPTFSYALGNIDIEKQRDKLIIRGLLGRIRREGQPVDKYDKEAHEFTRSEITNIADHKVEFAILPDYHLMFFEKHSVIRPKYFAEKFEKIYNSSAHTAGNLTIEFIVLKTDFYEHIKKWDLVNKAIFSALRPTNPSSLDDFAELEGLLKETHSEKTKLEFKTRENKDGAEEKGLNYESKLINQAMGLTSHGYGHAEFKGVQDNEEVEVSSGEFIRTEEIDFQSESSNDDIIDIAQDIQKNE